MSLLSRVLRKPGVMKELLRSSYKAYTGTAATRPELPEEHSAHKSVIHLYDLFPVMAMNVYVAPNASVVGEVYLEQFANVWDRAVLRGDLNAVKVSSYASIRENVCISNVSSLPTGQPSFTYIGPYTIVQEGCTLVSCDIGAQCLIGSKSVILEGAKVEDEAIVGPNSVVPPGRLIPTHQVWAGNPVRYVRDVTKAEIWKIKTLAVQNSVFAKDYSYNQASRSNAHLLKENKASENEDAKKYLIPDALHEHSHVSEQFK